MGLGRYLSQESAHCTSVTPEFGACIERLARRLVLVSPTLGRQSKVDP